MAKRKILIIEDEKDLALGLRDAFEFEGWSVETAERGADGIELAKRFEPNLFILDLMLPDMNGFQVCAAVRERYKATPILILSARSQESDIIRGLETGADDYVTKPFSIGELLARVRAIFRRADLAGRRQTATISVGEAEVNVETHMAVVHGEEVDLGFYATAILQLLDEHRGEPVTRDDILDAVWGMDANPTNRTVDNFIMKLRRKIEADPAQPRHILTVYGQGYKLV